MSTNLLSALLSALPLATDGRRALDCLNTIAPKKILTKA
jgi:hypothetical protein